MKILVINAGSSSLKVQLFESKGFSCLYKKFIDRLNDNYEEALEKILQDVKAKKIIKNFSEIGLVAHRVVHGGDKYTNPTPLTPSVMKAIKALCKLAPLHNPANIAGIEACQKIFANTTHVAIFDTAFYQTLEEKAYLYAVPYEWYKNYGVRRYGFHGTSHAYLVKATTKLLGKTPSKIITCHLGNGCSITATKNGKAIDTSMGFTPLEGVPMGTRSGDIDPAIIPYLMQVLHQPQNKIFNQLNHESGLKGISQLSSDVRDLWKAKNNKQVKLAFEVMAYRIAKYIGAYATALNGVDAITFSGGIGQHAYYLREQVCNYLTFLGLNLESSKNKNNAITISTQRSKIKVFVIPTDEEKEMATQAYQAIKKATHNS